MTTHQWSPPGNLQQAYPNCWGNPRSFDPNSRECRGCGVQTTCKERVDAQRAATTYSPPAASYSPPVFPQPNYQPAPWQAPQVSTNPWAKPPSAPAWPPAQQAPQVNSAVISQQAMAYYQQGQEYYGRYNDPIHYAIASAPLPPRMQMQGETFAGRFMKNVFLGALESVAEEALKGVRQMVLPPAPPRTPTSNTVIDVK